MMRGIDMLARVSRCGGVIEAVRMCRESYPSRYSHQDFYGTFNCLCPGAQGGDMKQAVAAMLQQLRVEPAKFRLGKTMVLLKREVVDNMESMRAKLLGGRAMVLQNTVRRFIAKQELAQKRDIRRKYSGCVKLQSICRRTITRAKYVRMVQAVRLQERKRREEEERKRQEEAAQRNASTAQKASIAQQQQEEQVRIQKTSQAQIPQTVLPRVALCTKCTRALIFWTSCQHRRKPLAPLSCRALPTASRRMTMPKMRLWAISRTKRRSLRRKICSLGSRPRVGLSRSRTMRRRCRLCVSASRCIMRPSMGSGEGCVRAGVYAVCMCVCVGGELRGTDGAIIY
jgi:hypothetical protein